MLHPHQDVFNAKTGMLNLIPDDIPTPRATLAANMETALNAIWDSGMSAADRVTVVGGGLVGLLVTYLAARFPGAEVTLVDVNPARAEMAEFRRAVRASLGDAPKNQDVVFPHFREPAGPRDGHRRHCAQRHGDRARRGMARSR